MADKPISILVVDDDPDILAVIQAGLSNNFEVSACVGVSPALELLKQRSFDVVLLDVEMPDVRGTVLAKEVRERFPDVGLIMFTAHNKPNMVNEAENVGADAYIAKPFCLNEMAREIREVYASKH